MQFAAEGASANHCHPCLADDRVAIDPHTAGISSRTIRCRASTQRRSSCPVVSATSSVQPNNQVRQHPVNAGGVNHRKPTPSVANCQKRKELPVRQPTPTPVCATGRSSPSSRAPPRPPRGGSIRTCRSEPPSIRPHGDAVGAIPVVHGVHFLDRIEIADDKGRAERAAGATGRPPNS